LEIGGFLDKINGFFIIKSLKKAGETGSIKESGVVFAGYIHN